MALSETVNTILNGPYPETEGEGDPLRALKIPPTYGAMLAYAVISKAIKGDVSAAKLVKDLMGEETAMNPSKNDFEKMSDCELLELLSDPNEESDGE